MTDFITQALPYLIPAVSAILVAEPIIFYSIYRKMKKAQVTDANADNSLKLIELQDKYIELIGQQDEKIKELQDERNDLSSKLTYYKTIHCCKLGCALREPPLGSTIEK